MTAPLARPRTIPPGGRAGLCTRPAGPCAARRGLTRLLHESSVVVRGPIQPCTSPPGPCAAPSGLARGLRGPAWLPVAPRGPHTSLTGLCTATPGLARVPQGPVRPCTTLQGLQQPHVGLARALQGLARVPVHPCTALVHPPPPSVPNKDVAPPSCARVYWGGVQCLGGVGAGEVGGSWCKESSCKVWSWCSDPTKASTCKKMRTVRSRARRGARARRPRVKPRCELTPCTLLVHGPLHACCRLLGPPQLPPTSPQLPRGGRGGGVTLIASPFAASPHASCKPCAQIGRAHV